MVNPKEKKEQAEIVLALYHPGRPSDKLCLVVLNMSTHYWHGGKIRRMVDFLTCNSTQDL